MNNGQTLDHFPLDLEPRDKQVKILKFIDRAIDRGYRDIVISAPTGCGKTGIGMALCFWGRHHAHGDVQAGGYYLVTQKILQDQIERDFRRFKSQFNNQSSSLKSSSEYPCEYHDTCKIGMSAKCKKLKETSCPYVNKRLEFGRAPLAVTNYPYFLTERTYAGQLEPRSILVCDEAHTIESQLLRFVEFSVTEKSIQDWAPHLSPPNFNDNVDKFLHWVEKTYRPQLASRLEMVKANLETNPFSQHWQRELTAHENQLSKAERAIAEVREDKDQWVFWQEKNNDAILKPLEASPYFPILQKHAGIRIYMSAYVGPSDIFCHSLGLDVDKVAHGKFSSTFPPANRPIFMNTVGSMSLSNIQTTLPKLLEECEAILDDHAKVKGIIHCHSYRLGNLIYDHLRCSKHANRIIFPTASHERTERLERHVQSTEPTVLLSPSMAEGFSLDDDHARFQIITKMPFPFLGDRQVRAKMDRDRDWYILETCKTFIQACGRIVRSDTDYGDTYMLDSDFLNVYEKHPEFFPHWLTQAFNW